MFVRSKRNKYKIKMVQEFRGEKVVMINPSLFRPTEQIDWSACPESLEDFVPLVVDKDMNILDGHHRFMFVHHHNRLHSLGKVKYRISEYPVIIVDSLYGLPE